MVFFFNFFYLVLFFGFHFEMFAFCLWSSWTFVTTFQRIIRCCLWGWVCKCVRKIAHRVDFTRALIFQPTNLILLANSIGCARCFILATHSLIHCKFRAYFSSRSLSCFYSLYLFSFHRHFTHDLHTFSFHNSFIFLFIQFAFFSCLLHGFYSTINQPTNQPINHSTVFFLFLNAIGISWRLTVLSLSWTCI